MAIYDDPKSKINQLEKVLDNRDDLISQKSRHHDLEPKENTAKAEWDDAVLDQAVAAVPPTTLLTEGNHKHASVSWKILWGSLIFFVLALLVAGFRFWGGGNIVSGDNINVVVRAPISIAGGEVLPFEIEIKNENNITLSGVDLGINFPPNTKSAVDTGEDIKRLQIFVGDILPGQSVKKNISVILFGTENEKQNIDISLAYKVKGSNSQFTKNKTVPILISSSPISLIISGPKEINTNQKVDLSVDITSNSPSVIKDVLLVADYPFGFTFTSANPKNFSKNNLWLLGDLNPGETRTVKFSGWLTGQEGEERGFNFRAGTQSKTDNLSLASVLNSTFSAVTIRRPFVSADLFLNGSNNADYVTRAGDDIKAVIRWQNNLPYQVSDVSISVRLAGNALNKGSVVAESGYYRSADDLILFNKNTNAVLANLGPGESGESSFSFKTFSINSVTGSALGNPVINLDVFVMGQRVDFGDQPEDVLFSESRKIKVSANPNLTAKILYYIGPFTNTGSLPPKAERETTYTVVWTVTNSLNNLAGAKVTAILPPYMKWLNQISPSAEKVVYDPGTNQVVWNVGNVSAGAGMVTAAREVAFQVSLLPSVSQIGTAPKLIGGASLTANDTFTLTAVGHNVSDLDTVLRNDPYYVGEMDKVVK